MNNSKVKKVNFYSSILGKEMSMLIYLHQCYNSVTFIPVLYFLHGRSGNKNIMFQIHINTKVDEMIIVCPRFENSRGVNSSLTCTEVPDPSDNNKIINLAMYEDYFIKEVVPLIYKIFNTIKNRKGRYIGGGSAGGYIVLHNTFRHQNMFSKVGGRMPDLKLTLEDEDKTYYKDINSWQKHDPIYCKK